MNITELKSRLLKAGQDHVLDHWDTLNENQKQNLIAQLQSIDLDELEDLVELHVKKKSSVAVDFGSLEPAPYIALPENGGSEVEWKKARELGEDAIREGRVAAFTVAGGQGTRLGYDGPKGSFSITPVRGASLFQVFAEKLISVRKIYDISLPWFIMTSQVNQAETLSFFKKNNYFGVPEEDVIFFSQGMMPAVDFKGRMILEKGDLPAMSPDGHGGSLRALVRSGATEEMKKRGVDLLSYFQVDNPLVVSVDPSFIGFHLLHGSEMSSKMIPKAYPEEKVGHFTLSDGHLTVIEYSDLPLEMAQQKNGRGQLRFNAGSIAIHLLSLAFIEKMGSGKGALPFHRADKKIAALQPDGSIGTPNEPNGVKFEMFVFDALPLAKSPIVVETAREEEFSPVKNAEGLDSPETCRKDLLRQYTRWLKDLGKEVSANKEGVPSFPFEISPLRGFDRTAFLENTKNRDMDFPTEGTVIQ